MLVLNRRIGQSIYIGDDVCVTVFGRRRHHTTIGVLAPPEVCVTYADPAVRPRVLESGAHFYLLTLLTGEGFVVGDAEVRVKFKGLGMPTLGAQSKQVRIAIQAPAHVQVHREEVYAQMQTADGLRSSALVFATWLQQANASLLRQNDATPSWSSAGACAPANAEFVFT